MASKIPCPICPRASAVQGSAWSVYAASRPRGVSAHAIHELYLLHRAPLSVRWPGRRFRISVLAIYELDKDRDRCSTCVAKHTPSCWITDSLVTSQLHHLLSLITRLLYWWLPKQQKSLATANLSMLYGTSAICPAHNSMVSCINLFSLYRLQVASIAVIKKKDWNISEIRNCVYPVG